MPPLNHRPFPDFVRPPGVVIRFAGFALAGAVAAMTALHVVQPQLSFMDTPVSFYVLGARGWLLSVALGLFGLAAIVLAIADPAQNAKRWLMGFGCGMLVDAVIKSDAQFPWEAPPSLSGLVHAAAAIAAPPLLLVPMISLQRFLSARTGPMASRVLTLTYAVALLGSGASLGFGFNRDVAPPLIGLAERVLALAAVIWLALLAYSMEQCATATPSTDRRKNI